MQIQSSTCSVFLMMDVLFRTENLTDIFAKIYMEIGITADPTSRIVQIYRLKTKQRTNGCHRLSLLRW
jgi:hypothetical protein